MKWEVVIGLETHAQLSTSSKIFSGSSTAFGAEPNTQASAVDIALPGVLPVLNQGAVERAIRFGLAVGGNINRRSVFARKNYFYPDLPKGYQISQYELPIVVGGEINFMVGDEPKKVRLTRAHLEEDAGKSLHEDFKGMSGIDLNRAGTPLLEIVSEPEMCSAAQAVAYAKALHALVRWIDICDGNMQEGSFRCDANVSIRRPGDPLGTRCEIKNLNSFLFLEQAISYEIRRQTEVLEQNGKVVQETRLYDPDKGETRSMRSKEDAMDYRYFPDPDLPPLAITSHLIEHIRSSMPELPLQKRYRFMASNAAMYQEIFVQQALIDSDADLDVRMSKTLRQAYKQAFHGLGEKIATALTATREISEFFEDLVNKLPAGNEKVATDWILGEVSAHLNLNKMQISDSPVSPSALARLIERLLDGTLNNKMAKEVFAAMWAGEGDADTIIAAKGLKQISDAGAIEKIVDQVIAANPKSVEEFKAGKEKAFNALVGQVMKATQGKANPGQVNELLKKKLGG